MAEAPILRLSRALRPLLEQSPEKAEKGRQDQSTAENRYLPFAHHIPPYLNCIRPSRACPRTQGIGWSQSPYHASSQTTSNAGEGPEAGSALALLGRLISHIKREVARLRVGAGGWGCPPTLISPLPGQEGGRGMIESVIKHSQMLAYQTALVSGKG